MKNVGVPVTPLSAVVRSSAMRARASSASDHAQIVISRPRLAISFAASVAGFIKSVVHLPKLTRCAAAPRLLIQTRRLDVPFIWKVPEDISHAFTQRRRSLRRSSATVGNRDEVVCRHDRHDARGAHSTT
jgi:hypothetical protein